MRQALIGIAALGLAACGTTGQAVQVKVEKVFVPTPISCPTAMDYSRLRQSRPDRLRSQKMPNTSEQRVAQMGAQLGRYEADGGWADQVMAALDRCQISGLAPQP